MADQARGWEAGLLPGRAGWASRAAFSDFQVPHHGGRCGKDRGKIPEVRGQRADNRTLDGWMITMVGWIPSEGMIPYPYWKVFATA